MSDDLLAIVKGLQQPVLGTCACGAEALVRAPVRTGHPDDSGKAERLLCAACFVSAYPPSGRIAYTIDDILAEIRRSGWMVAVHNDYRQHGVLMTFWLFTHEGGRYVKGEGRTDVEALHTILEAIS